jgi:predicted nuclease of predicted toxin-antitoxin system
VRFLVDNQLPAALAKFLSALGLHCEHVIDVGLAEAKDREIWRLATAQKMVLISKDEDFFHLANRPESQVQLIWVRLGNCRNQALMDAMGSAWPRIQSCLEAGERVVELR